MDTADSGDERSVTRWTPFFPGLARTGRAAASLGCAWSLFLWPCAPRVATLVFRSPLAAGSSGRAFLSVGDGLRLLE